MQIRMACPAPPGSRFGNRNTATRWTRLLRQLGHSVCVTQSASFRTKSSDDLLIALHAKLSAKAISEFAEERPDQPIILALTGTDLYRDIRSNRAAQRSLRLANRLIVLHEKGNQELPQEYRAKTRTIIQSAPRTPVRCPTSPRFFRVLVIGHLRHEKDPFRAAKAARGLPPESRIRIEHYGGPRNAKFAVAAQQEMRKNVRYQWYGDQPRWKVRRRLACAQLLVLSSRIEGGATVISEALADRVPIVCSRIVSSEGLLGDDYPGFFPVGDTDGLRIMLHRAEIDVRFLRRLKSKVSARSHLVRPQRERASWKKLLAESLLV